MNNNNISVSSTDLLDNIFDSMDNSLFPSEAPKPSNSLELLPGIEKTFLAKKPSFDSKYFLNFIYYNSCLFIDKISTQTKRYSIVSLDSMDNHLLLVRTTNHGTDQHGKSISLTVKPEFLPEVGADVSLIIFF